MSSKGNSRKNGLACTGVAGREGVLRLASVWEEGGGRKGMSVQ